MSIFDILLSKAYKSTKEQESLTVKKLSPQYVSYALKRFFQLEAAGGILLVIFTILALVFANSGLDDLYNKILYTKFSVLYGDVGLSKPLLYWINDGLMALFFFLVGLEVKREFIRGELSTKETALLPAIAAVGGMAVPALIYYAVTHENETFVHGWAIPSATDIAFALGILALLGSRAPVALKILLTAIAVMDDIGAVVIIALFYTSDLTLIALIIAAICIVVLLVLNRSGTHKPTLFIIVGIILWLAVLKSGIHATLAGVVTAFFIPLKRTSPEGYSMGESLEHALHPWVVFLILPIFAFANAGVSFRGMSFDILLEPVTLGIILGLFVGKQLGIFGTIWLSNKTGIARKPDSVTWQHIYGLAALCGIGFTMSLFIGTLAFTSAELEREVRLGVLVGSTLSAILGTILLLLANRATKTDGTPVYHENRVT